MRTTWWSVRRFRVQISPGSCDRLLREGFDRLDARDQDGGAAFVERNETAGERGPQLLRILDALAVGANDLGEFLVVRLAAEERLVGTRDVRGAGGIDALRRALHRAPAAVVEY